MSHLDQVSKQLNCLNLSHNSNEYFYRSSHLSLYDKLQHRGKFFVVFSIGQKGRQIVKKDNVFISSMNVDVIFMEQFIESI